MNRTRIAAILLSMAPLLPAAFAKDAAPSAPAGTAEVQLIQASPKPPTRANQGAAADVDARRQQGLGLSDQGAGFRDVGRRLGQVEVVGEGIDHQAIQRRIGEGLPPLAVDARGFPGRGRGQVELRRLIDRPIDGAARQANERAENQPLEESALHWHRGMIVLKSAAN